MRISLQQQQINYRPDDDKITEAPIGNIVYEINEEDNNQNNYNDHDVARDNIREDFFENYNAFDSDDGADADADDAAENADGSAKENTASAADELSIINPRHKFNNSGGRSDARDERQQVSRQRHKITHEPFQASDKLINKQTIHKNWGKWNRLGY